MVQFNATSANEIVVESEGLRLLLQPLCGGKIKSLFSKTTGREFFWQDPRTVLSSRDYVAHDLSGYDECLPTIADCLYPDEPFKGRALGDHGSVWDKQWEARIEEDRVVTSVEASTLPLRLIRTLSLPEPRRVRLDYAITNTSEHSLKFVWSAHPCFAVGVGSRVVFPDSVKAMRVCIPGPFVVEDGKIPWPEVEMEGGGRLNLNTDFDVSRGFNAKLFAVFEDEGWCELHHADGESVRFDVPVDKVPYCGAWINQGGLIFDEANPTCIVALEPCTGLHDELPVAETIGSVSQLGAGEKLEFSLTITVSS